MSSKGVHAMSAGIIVAVAVFAIALLYLLSELDEKNEQYVALLSKHEALTSDIIHELMSLSPTVSVDAIHYMKALESRRFTLAISGLSEDDEITIPPEMHVYKDGVEVETLKYHSNISDSISTQSPNTRMYYIDWQPRFGSGAYELRFHFGTNRISLLPDMAGGEARIKIGGLIFTKKQIRSALDQHQQWKAMNNGLLAYPEERLEGDHSIIRVVVD